MQKVEEYKGERERVRERGVGGMEGGKVRE